MSKENKTFRVLKLYKRFYKDEYVKKSDILNEFKITDKTFQRDLQELRAYLSCEGFTSNEDIIYDRNKKKYYMIKENREWLNKTEVISVLKIILESRAFIKKELDIIYEKLIHQVAKEDRKFVELLLKNEKHHYVELSHGKHLMQLILDLSFAITKKEIISVNYTNKSLEEKEHILKPVSLMFSEFYFYLLAFIENKDSEHPIVFRLDRISSFEKTGKKFNVSYKDNFNTGEFRKRVHFMYSGDLKKVKFKYNGSNIDMIIDRLPTSEIIEKNDDHYIIETKVYGEGIHFWLRSLGELVEIIE